jgi:hypothetical protein
MAEVSSHHYVEAERDLRAASEDITEEGAQTLVARAQVHAILALADAVLGVLAANRQKADPTGLNAARSSW